MAMIDPSQDQEELTPEEQKKKKFQAIADQQAASQRDSSVEPGIEQENELSIANLPKKAAVGKLRAEGMPGAATVADLAIPELDPIGLGTQALREGKTAFNAVSRELSPEQEARLAQFVKNKMGGDALDNIAENEASLLKYKALPGPEEEARLARLNPENPDTYTKLGRVDTSIRADELPTTTKYTDLKMPGSDIPVWKRRMMEKRAGR